MSHDVCIFVPVAIRAIMETLAPQIEAAGVALIQTVDLNPAIPERILAGEDFDIGITNPTYVTALVAAGRVDAASQAAFGRVPLAIGRKAGADRALLKDTDQIKALLRGAKSIAYTGAGTSGRTYLGAMERLGLSSATARKSIAMGGGEPVASVAAGETELAVAPLTTLLATPGVVAAAVFPDDLGTHIDMSVFLSTRPRTGAAHVRAFLTDPAQDDALAASGLFRFTLPLPG